MGADITQLWCIKMVAILVKYLVYGHFEIGSWLPSNLCDTHFVTFSALHYTLK